MYKLFILCIVTLIIGSSQLVAKNLIIAVKAKQEFTGKEINDFKGWMVPLGSNDTVYGSISTSYNSVNGYTIKESKMCFSVPNADAAYILTARCPGYEDFTDTVMIKKRTNRNININLDDIYFHKKAKKLGEVVVKATKVKFYAKGDTLVFNADAFALPEGSMLDALVKQLPGVEIRDGGEIYVNGKYVEDLLLNGSDFLKGNKELMLNNLAAYTIENVYVYDKMSERSKLAGQVLGDSEFVMDVKLKRDYMSGFVGNIEGGAGTNSRYLGRLFSMWYTTRSRLALIANVNNLNDSREPGQNDQYTATNIPGDFRTKMAGLDYYIKSDNSKTDWNFTGNTTVSHVRSYSQTDIGKINFLSGGDTYENSFDKSIAHNLTVKSSNNFQWRPKDRYLGVIYKFNYLNRDRTANSLSGTFNSEIKDITQKVLETIYSGEAASLAGITLNSTLTRSILSGNSFSTGGGINFDTKIPSTPDLLSTSFHIDYDRSNYYGFDRYDINYNRENTHSTNYGYTRNHPDHNFKINAGTAYTFVSNEELSMLLSTYYFYATSTKDSYFYQLDRLSDAGIFGSLPADYQAALDEGQSNMSTQYSHDAYIQYNFNYFKKFASGNRLNISLKPVAEFVWRCLDFRLSNNTQLVKDNSFKLWFYNTFIKYIIGKNTLLLKFDRNVKLVPLDRLVTITDTRDPLNIYVGSKSLKNSAQNDFTLGWMHSAYRRHPWSSYVSLAYSVTQNELISTYSFNSQTGVRTYMMQNVNGNWYARIHDDFYKGFGSIDQFDITATTRLTYGHNADLTATDNTTFSKNKIKNLNISENFRFNWRINKQNLGLRVLVDWRDIRGNRHGFRNFTATTVQYGINGNFVLPYNLSIATDLNLYARRGFAYKELNTTDLVWNARLSYAPKGGNWVFMLDGFDLLHQLSNITHNINAQGRTETWTNVLPRYALLHIRYKFDKRPQKR